MPMAPEGRPSVTIPDVMRAWALFGPDDLRLVERPVPRPDVGEVLVRVEAVAICATDLEILRHEYAGTVVALGPTVDEFKVGDRVVVEVHAGCGRCQRCRQGMYTSCLNYSFRRKGHRANGFTTDGAFAEFAVNHVNTLYKLPDHISFEEATLVVTAGTALYGIDVLGGL